MPVTFDFTLSMFKGNSFILNYYSESASPQEYLCSIYKTVGFVVCMATMMGVTAYLAYGDDMEDSVMFNLPNDTLGGLFIQSLYLIAIFGSFIVQSQPVFQVFESMKCYESFDQYPITARLIERFLVVMVLLVTCLIFPDIVTAGTIAGAVLSPFLTFLIPCLCYLKIYSFNEPDGSPNKRSWTFKWIWIFMIFGLTIDILGFCLLIYDLVVEDEDALLDKMVI
mmetsp:Transcript_17918/g.12861  ORF Transcript_17918/g.12861 Transcript_17918/m.12861 type:complete len:224 (-) Transcript_17918:37-708(-)